MSVSGYMIESWTQHWELIDGTWYRNAVAIRVADGQRRMIAVRDDLAA